MIKRAAESSVCGYQVEQILTRYIYAFPLAVSLENDLVSESVTESRSEYRVTILVDSNLPLTSKHKFRFNMRPMYRVTHLVG